MTIKSVLRVFIFSVVLCFMCCIISCAGDNGKGEIAVYQNTDIIVNGTDCYDFGIFNTATTTPEVTFTIKNTGDGKLLLTGEPKIEITGDGAASFIVDESKTSSSLVPGVSTTFTIKFYVDVPGEKFAQISIKSDDPECSAYTFYVVGSLLVPEIHVMQGGTEILGSSSLYNISSPKIGTNPEIEFTIKNAGNGNLLLTGNKIEVIGADSAYFVVDDSATSSEIAPGDSTTFKIKFNDNDFQDRSAKASISNNDKNPFTFNIVGSVSHKYEWTKTFENSIDNSYMTIEVDSSNNLIFAGAFYRTTDIGLQFGVSDPITCDGRRDVFIAKILENNTYGWTRKIGSTSNIIVYDIAVDSQDNVYIVGEFYGIVDFGKDFGVIDGHNSIGENDIYVTKILANGDYGWTKTFGGKENDIGSSIICDSDDNLYIGCNFRDVVDFGASSGVTDVKTVKGECDIAIVKIKANGDYCWTKQFSSSRGIYLTCISNDYQDNVYFTGSFCETTDFGSDFGVTDIKTYSSGQNFDMFITKITAHCTYCWTKTISGDTYIRPNSVNHDSSGNIYITGQFIGAVNFANDFGGTDVRTAVQPSSGYPTQENRDIFILKINADSSYGFVKQFGNEKSEYPAGLIIDNRDNIYFTGFYDQYAIDFGNEFGVTDVKTPSTSIQMFLTKFTTDSTYFWTKLIGYQDDSMTSNDSASPINIAISKNNCIYISGVFRGTVDFGKPFGASDKKTASKSADIFIMKISE